MVCVQFEESTVEYIEVLVGKGSVEVGGFSMNKLNFCFDGSGMCRMVKQNDRELNKPKLMKHRKYLIKKFLKKMLLLFRKNLVL